MVSNNLYFLKVSGSVGHGKEKEFHQTVRFIFNHLPMECTERTLSVDTQNSQLFHIFLRWISASSLFDFQRSNEFELLKGLFQTVGDFIDTASGRQVDIELFELNHLNP